MIRRQYFMYARKPWTGKQRGYTYRYVQFSHKSWLPNPGKAFKDMLDDLTNELEHIEGDPLEVMAFNRC